MDVSTSVRRSGRRKVRPVEFWNLEDSKDAKSEDISYNISYLCKHSISDNKNILFLKSGTKHSTCTGTAVSINRTQSILDSTQDKRGNQRQPKTERAGKQYQNKNISTLKVDAKQKDRTDGEEKTMPKKVKKDDKPKSRDMSLPSEFEKKTENCVPSEPRDKEPDEVVGQETFSRTDLELPSFQNVLSSTAISFHSMSNLVAGPEAKGFSTIRNNNQTESAFKIPNIKLFRHQKKWSSMVQSSMDVIKEESTTDVSWDDQTTQESVSAPVNNKTQNFSRVGNVGEAINSRPSVLSVTHDKSQAPAVKTNVSGPSERHNKENTMQASISNSANNTVDTSTFRRSGRIRTKCLEFWNFEKAKVTLMDDGKLDITYTKKDLPSRSQKLNKFLKSQSHASRKNEKPTVSTRWPSNSSMQVPSTPSDPSKLSQGGIHMTPPARASCSKRKLCSPGHNTLKETVEEEMAKHRKVTASTSCSKRKLCTPGHNTLKETVKEVKAEEAKHQKVTEESGLSTTQVQMFRFKEQLFHPVETQSFKAYFARYTFQSSIGLFMGLIFLEWGCIVWKTTKIMNLYVIEGLGNLKMSESEENGLTCHLKTTTAVRIPSGMKVLLQKDGRSKMLKSFISILGPKCTSDPNYTIEVDEIPLKM